MSKTTDQPTRVTFRELLGLERTDDSTFRAPSVECAHPRVFGGQLVAQGLAAAGRTIPPGHLPNSLHAYFLRGVDPGSRLDYRVSIEKDGRTIGNRRVTAHQGGKVVFAMSASFYREVDSVPPASPSHGAASELPSWSESTVDDSMAGSPLSRFPATDSFEIRFITRDVTGPRPFHPYWVRCREPLDDDPLLSSCAIAFISDMGFLSAAIHPNRVADAYTGASLDHSLWFGHHESPHQWLLVEGSHVMAHDARGVGAGRIQTESGDVVAVVGQEGMFR